MSIGQIKEEIYNELITKAVSDYGNYYRIKKAIKKAESNDVTIAFLGGSVTIGYNPQGSIKDNYAQLFCNFVKDRFCVTGNCNYVNGGYASTDAMHGLAFTEFRIKNAQPDIVFVEYAINNGADRTYLNAFESLVYKLLIMESEPAVIPIIVCNERFYSCSNYMETVAKYYDLPVVNLYNLITYGINNNLMTWSNYSNDLSHPTKDGHKLIADCIIRLFESMDDKDEFYKVPEAPCYTRDFYTFEFIDHNQISSVENCEFVPSETMEVFPGGWIYDKNKLGNSFRFEITCRALFIAYEQANSMDYGVIEIWDNGSFFSTLEGYSIYAWGNPVMKLVINDAEAKKHKIEIRIRKGDENKKFVLLGFGVI